MVNYYLYVILSGDGFSPIKVENEFKISFTKKNEVGEFGKIGRYKGRVIPFGSAVLESCSSSNLEDHEWILTCLERMLPALDKYGATEIILHLDVEYEGQCNFELPNEFLQKVSKLNMCLTVSCYTENYG